MNRNIHIRVGEKTTRQNVLKPQQSEIHGSISAWQTTAILPQKMTRDSSMPAQFFQAAKGDSLV